MKLLKKLRTRRRNASPAFQVRPPRALFVPFPHGYPLGAPHDRERQTKVILAALALLDRRDVPVIEDYAE